MKFNLRDLFWLILVAAILVGWCVDHWRDVSEFHRQSARFMGTTLDTAEAEAAHWKKRALAAEQRLAEITDKQP